MRLHTTLIVHPVEGQHALGARFGPLLPFTLHRLIAASWRSLLACLRAAVRI